MEKLKKNWKRLGLFGVLGVAILALSVVAGTELLSQDDEEVSLDAVPAAVKATILEEADGAEVKEVEKEVEDGKVVYEADIVVDGQEVEVKVAEDGTLLSREIDDEDEEGDVDDDEDEDDEDDEDEVEVSLDEVPAVVKATILKEANGAEIKEIEKEVEDGKVVYEAEFEVDGQEVEVEVAEDGTLLSREIDDEDEVGDVDDDEDEDNEDEVEVSLDEVPAAVKATILKEANGAEVEEVEKEVEDGKVVYEAEFMVDGQEVEIEVAEDGTLLSREIDNEDEEGDDAEDGGADDDN
ncbi:MAG: PepSY-like domain-containing protein [Sedimentisphaerales bacterium]|nr:PepSY-like domain-containing protein [Sedimentisphaerales bacterium]